MHLQQRINAFVKLGTFLSQYIDSTSETSQKDVLDDSRLNDFNAQIELAYQHNKWFTKENIVYALKGWSEQLTESNITQWVSKYHFNDIDPKNVAIIMAGNIPLVGFHDFLSVLMAGHNVLVKQSSNDKHLLPFLASHLEHIEPEFTGKIEFTEGTLSHFDAVIATGSNNTARYFEYYFKNKPSIIRKNRNSVAALTGEETHEQLLELSEDIFRYYGLGCRNVSKLFVPKGYDFEKFFNAIFHWKDIIHQHKYANNYDYNKAVYLMSEFDLLDNGFLMIKEDESYGSPIATLFYDYYDSISELETKLKSNADSIQCVVSQGLFPNDIQFGQTQQPELWDYADNVDTITFLSTI